MDTEPVLEAALRTRALVTARRCGPLALGSVYMPATPGELRPAALVGTSSRAVREATAAVVLLPATAAPVDRQGFELRRELAALAHS